MSNEKVSKVRMSFSVPVWVAEYLDKCDNKSAYVTDCIREKAMREIGRPLQKKRDTPTERTKEKQRARLGTRYGKGIKKNRH